MTCAVPARPTGSARLVDADELRDRSGFAGTVNAMRALLSSRLLLAALSFVLGGSLVLPRHYETGAVIRLDESWNALVVSSGYRNALYKVQELTSRVAPRELSTDNVVEGALAYAAAQQVLNEVTHPGIVLIPYRDGPLWRAGFRPRDIVTSVVGSGTANGVKSKRCREASRWVEASQWWEFLASCDATLNLLRDGKRLALPLRAEQAVGGRTEYLASTDFPELPRDLQGSTGLSATLALALFFLDQRTKGSLAAGLVVASTGVVLGSDLKVSAIGSLDQKAAAAHRAGVQLLFVPYGQRRELPELEGMHVVEVTSLYNAVAELCHLGSDDAVCRLVAGPDANP